MAQNEKLEETVLKELYNYLKTIDPLLDIMADSNEYIGADIVKVGARVVTDQPYKIRIFAGTFIGYGYDFTKQDDSGNPAEKVYDEAVVKTRIMSGRPNFEKFIKEGIDGNFGWYITQL